MLEFQNISLHKKRKKILDHFSLSLSEGTIFGLVGEDSLAKSAILQAAVGSIRPSAGKILLDGESIHDSDTCYLKIGYMSRKFDFYDQMTVGEYFELFLALYKVNGRYRNRRVDEVLQFFELESYKDTFVSELPLELKPFLNLGKTILHDPDWLFLDEPFEELSPSQRKRMLEYLGILWEDGKSLLINTRLFPEITQFITDIAIIEEGQMISKGTVSSVYKEVLRKSPIRLRILDGMDAALAVLRENPLVERVTVNGQDVILLFSGEDLEEARLLSQLVSAGALVHHFIRDPLEVERYM